MKDLDNYKNKDYVSNTKIKSSPSINKDAGDKLRALRENKRLSQEKLANNLCISIFRLRRYEMGIVSIPVDVMHRVCEIFHVGYDYFTTSPTETGKQAN